MYKLTSTGMIFRIADSSYIPLDMENIDYKAYLLWLSEGNSPGSLDVDDDHPISCTRRQGRRALLKAGYLEKVEDYIESIEDPQEKMAARIEYEAETWESSSQFVIDTWSVLGGTKETLEDLFLLAATL